MHLPIATPGATGDHLADLLLRLEAKLSPELALTALAVRNIGGAIQPWVIVHHDDGARDRLSAGDARLVARALRDDLPPPEGGRLGGGAFERARAWADSLDEAADAADRQAAACLIRAGAGAGVGGPDGRRFQSARQPTRQGDAA